jgi:hypothetical protein
VLNAAIDDVMTFASNRITLIVGKSEENLYDSMPEAISQAIALSEVSSYSKIRCLRLSEFYSTFDFAYRMGETGSFRC